MGALDQCIPAVGPVASSVPLIGQAELIGEVRPSCVEDDGREVLSVATYRCIWEPGKDIL